MKPSEDWNEATPALAEQAIGYTFSDKELLNTCFTHKTFANNHKIESNERLEFLGDAVLQLAVSEVLYSRGNNSEGSMTQARQRLVAEEPLNEAMKKADILRFLRYASDEKSIGYESQTPSNLFEAVTAGIYLDGGMNAARAFLKRFLVEIEIEDYKSHLQEYVQDKVKEKPDYSEAVAVNGGYTVTVRALGKEAEGFGRSKQQAEFDAAEKLLTLLKEGIE